jgi:predicted helicase
MFHIFPDKNTDNKVIGFMGQPTDKPFAVISSNLIPDLNCISPASRGTQCLPLYRYDEKGDRICEFPRLPFYEDFHQWAAWGRSLMDLHLNYETIEPYGLQRVEIATKDNPKAKLKADKTNGAINLDDNTQLIGVEAIAWEYKLGNRSALEWILDQYKEKKPKDPTITKLFNTYKFADYKEQLIDLLQRVCTVSVKTMEIIQRMSDIY